MDILDTTLAQINRLSEERQKLWRAAGRQRLTDEQRERVAVIGTRLERLWNLHRCEVAVGVQYYQTPIDRLDNECFADFCERTHMRGGMGSKWRIRREDARETWSEAA